MYQILWAFPDEPDNYTLYAKFETLEQCLYTLSKVNTEPGDKIKILKDNVSIMILDVYGEE